MLLTFAWLYFSVILVDEWPKSFDTLNIDTPSFTNCDAKECLEASYSRNSLLSPALFLIPFHISKTLCSVKGFPVFGFTKTKASGNELSTRCFSQSKSSG